MFGEVFDTSKSFTSQFTTRNKMQAVLDFPFQDAARNFASRGQAAKDLETFFAGDDWYTDADSNVYELPTFLGNHDMGRIGSFISADNPDADDAERVARDRLAHELMYFSRGNPVVYYGDEQGFTGPGGDQDARQTTVREQGPGLPRRRSARHRRHARGRQLQHRPTRCTAAISELAALTTRTPGAAQRRAPEPLRLRRAGHLRLLPDRRQGPARVRGRRQQQRAAQTAAVPTYVGQAQLQPDLRRRGRRGQDRRGREADGHGAAAVRRRLRVRGPHPALQGGPRRNAAGAGSVSRGQQPRPGGGRRRRQLLLRGHLRGHAPTAANGPPIGTDDTAPYQVFHDVSALDAGTAVEYRAVVLDNGVAHLGEPAPQRHRSGAGLEPGVPQGGQQRQGQGRNQCSRQPGKGRLHGPVRAQHQRRRLVGNRPGQLLPRLHRRRRPGRAGAGGRHPAPLPGPDGRSGRGRGGQRDPHRRGRGASPACLGHRRREPQLGNGLPG